MHMHSEQKQISDHCCDEARGYKPLNYVLKVAIRRGDA